MAKNCTCSQLKETIDKIFIDDSCCCQSTVVTPTDNCCSCEPVIDLIDTDKFACTSLSNDRNLKYQIIKESWLVYGTNSGVIYDTIIDAQASEIMLLLKILGGEVDGNNKNYVISPIEISRDVEQELYIIKYFKFIEGKLNTCIYTIHKIGEDNYETSWNSELLDNFDASQYYTKIESDNKFATLQDLINNYYTINNINTNFYNKTEVDEKILWEVGEGQYSTQRIGANCEARGKYSLAAGKDNKTYGNCSVALGCGNTNLFDSKNTFTVGYENTVTGADNIVAGYKNTIQGEYNFAAGSSNQIIDGNYSGVLGQSNKVRNHSIASGYNNTTIGSYSVALGRDNEVTENYSSAIGRDNKVNGINSIALGKQNNITKDVAIALGYKNQAQKDYSLAVNEYSRADGISSIAGGRMSYTGSIGACAVGNTLDIKYYAKVVDSDDGLFVLTDEQGDPVNITDASIQYKRFNFHLLSIDRNKIYWGQLTVKLPDNTPLYSTLSSVKLQEEQEETHLYFTPSSTTINNTTNIDMIRGQRNSTLPISYASGYDGCKSIGLGAHAEGQGTIAQGDNSHSEGLNTIALNKSEHACGKYNYSHTNAANNNTLFSIGIGSEEQTNTEDGSDVTITRKNALEVTQNGTIYLRISNNNTEKVYDLGKLLTALIGATSIDVTNIEVDSRQMVQTNEDTLAEDTKAL